LQAKPNATEVKSEWHPYASFEDKVMSEMRVVENMPILDIGKLHDQNPAETQRQREAGPWSPKQEESFWKEPVHLLQQKPVGVDDVKAKEEKDKAKEDEKKKQDDDKAKDKQRQGGRSSRQADEKKTDDDKKSSETKK